MKNTNEKIIVLKNHVRARGLLELSDAEDILKYEQRELRTLDREVAALLLEKHKLKETENLRNSLTEINLRLLEVSD